MASGGSPLRPTVGSSPRSEPKGIGIVETEATTTWSSNLASASGMRLRARRTVRTAGQEWPVGRHLESGRWNEQRASLQEHPVLPDRRRIRRLRERSRPGLFRRSARKPSPASQFSVEGHALEYYVIYGPTPKEILEKYTSLTGRPACRRPGRSAMAQHVL